MPPTDPVRKQPKRQTVNPARPDAGDTTRTTSAAHAQTLVPKSGDAPQTRAQDTRRAEAYKLTPAYIRQVQAARAVQAHQLRNGILSGFQRETPSQALSREDRDAISAFRFDPQRDIPRTDTEIAHFLRTGQQPIRRPTHEVTAHDQAAKLAPVLTILNQLSRPVHGEAAAARAVIAHKPVLKAAKAGLTLKDNSTFSDVLADAGVHNKIAKGVGGFALDVGLDPTTYLTFGVSSVGRKAAEAEARKATQVALKAGASKNAANKAGRAAAKKVLATETNRGVTIGALGKRTSGRTTAKAARALHIPQASERARAALPGRLLRHVAPSVKPAGVSEQAFLKVRAALVRGRAVSVNGERQARNRAQAIARALPGDSHPQITDALEGRSLAGLSDKERKVTQALAHDYDQMHRAEHAAGLVGPKFKDFGYSPRRAVSELEPVGSRKRLGGAQLESSKARTNRRAYKDFRGTADDIYTENHSLAYYLRARDSAVKLGRKVVIDTLHEVGQRWHPGVALKDGEEIYKFAPGKMPVKVEGDELKSLMRGGAPPGLNEYRALHTNLVKVAEQGVPERLEGLEELGRIWDRQIQGRIKTILTVPNPQYHLTNLYGDLFNAYKAAPVAALAKNLGISVAALTYRARREAAAKALAKQIAPSGVTVKIGGHSLGLDDLIKEAETHGAINQGFIGRDLAEVLDRQGKEASQRLGRGKVARRTKVGRKLATNPAASRLAHPIDTIRDISQYREDAVRLALYLGRRKAGDTADEAARFTNRHLFDYGDLTQFERSVLRRVLPFYTFSARNFPQQVRALIERPGKYATLEKVREEALKASSIQPGYEENLQKYEQQGAPIPIPGTSNLLYPKLPVTDLGRLTLKDQGNYLMSMLTPLIKTPVELDQNYSFFLRKNIDDLVQAKGPHGETVETLKPAPPVVLALLSKVPGPLRKNIAEALRLKQYTDQKTQKKVVGWPARIDYVWRATPATSFASSAGSQIPNSRGQTAGQATFGYLTGLKVAPYSPPDVAKNNAGKSYDYLQAVAKKMRHDGTAYDAGGNRTKAYQKVLDQSRAAFAIIDPTPPKHSSFLSPEAQKALDEVRKQVGGGGGLSSDAQAALANLRTR